MTVTPESKTVNDIVRQTVLIVDDNPVNIETLTDYLETSNLEVLIALSGEQGIERAERAQPDLILLDIVMPGMDGIETCQRLKKNETTAQIPIIFMTALNESEYKVRAFQVGAVDYITKPFEKGEVLARVRAHIQLHALTEKLEQQIQARTAELEQTNEQLQQKIAEQDHTEARLRESETKYRQLVEQMNEGVAVVQDMAIKYVNGYLAQLGGYSAEDCIEHPLLEFIPTEEHSKLVNNYQRRLNGENVPTIYESILKSKSGRNINVEVNVSHTEYHGKPAELVILRDITESKRIEAALDQRVIALARPLGDEKISFSDLFNLDEIQKIQDAFAAATHVSSIITTPTGEPITQPSNFSRLCREIIRKTPEGLSRCIHSDAIITRRNPDGPIAQTCLSAGLRCCGTNITAGEHYIANWIIGQVRDENFDEGEVLKFAREIGADENEVKAALKEMTVMSAEQFSKISRALFRLSNLMSRIAYQNIQQARFIVEHDLAEKALRDNEERLRKIVGTMPVLLDAFDEKGDIIYWNEACARVIGYTEAEVIHNPRIMEQLYPDPKYREWVNDSVNKELGNFTNLEFELTCKDGSRRIIAWSNISQQAPIPGWHTWAVGTDVTERKQMEAALKEEKERFRRLTENAKDIIYRMSLFDGSYEYISLAAETITGYAPEEFYQSPALIQRILHPDWQEYFREQFSNLAQGKMPPSYEYQIIHKSGEVKWVNQRNVLIRDENGAPIAIEGIATDVSERKRAEQEHEQLLVQIQEQVQRIQQIVNTVPEGVLLLDARRRVTLANPTGIGDLQTLAGAQIGDVITQLGEHPVETLLTSPPKGLWHEVSTQGREFQIIARPFETGPASGGWVLVIRDVTQQRELDRHVQQRERLAAVGQLAAGIAHDFNNIMATIVLYAQMTERTQGISDRIRERMHTINQQAQHATNLIRQILDFSRRSVIERRPMDLLPFLNEQVKMLKRTLPENIAITLGYQPYEYLINADPTSIQQMVMNLVVNARDAMLDGGALQIELDKIYIESRNQAPLPRMNTGEWIRLGITDNGTGMTEEVRRHLFEPFFTTKAPGQGNGLGLAQVHGIVGSHEGHIAVESQPGVGTTFKLYFPALPTQTSPDATRHKMAAISMGHGETVLIAEDNETTRLALMESLTTLNYRVLMAANGKEALDVLAQHEQEIALILSDVVMPEAGGLALLNTLREQKRLKPFLLLTGHPLKTELDTLRDLESDTSPIEWMTKPPNFEDLADKIRRILTKTEKKPEGGL